MSYGSPDSGQLADDIVRYQASIYLDISADNEHSLHKELLKRERHQTQKGKVVVWSGEVSYSMCVCVCDLEDVTPDKE